MRVETGPDVRATCHNALPTQLLPSSASRRSVRDVLSVWLVAGTSNDGEGGVTRVFRIRDRPLAEAERGTALALDDPRMATRCAQPGIGRRHDVAERVGFEPTKSFDSALFKSAAINRSATSPPERIAVRGRCGVRLGLWTASPRRSLQDARALSLRRGCGLIDIDAGPGGRLAATEHLPVGWQSTTQELSRAPR